VKRSRQKISRNGRKAVAAAEEWERKTKRVGTLAEFSRVRRCGRRGSRLNAPRTISARRTYEVLLQTKCDFSRLLRIVPGDTLMRLRPNWSNVRRSRSVSSGLRTAENGLWSRDLSPVRRPLLDRWWQVWWQRRGTEGCGGEPHGQ